MEPQERISRKVIRISLRKFVWSIIVIIVMLIGGYVYLQMTRLEPAQLTDSEIPAIPMSGGATSPQYYDDRYNPYGADITDTREFLKTSYLSQIKTRDVAEVVSDVKNAVRDVEGRVDNLSSGDKNGSISFVVPKSRFEAFRAEVESTTHRKLYTESISSQNLLNQKQSLEQQTQSATSTLAVLEKQKNDLTTRHTQTTATLNRQITLVQTELALVRQRIASSQNEQEIAELQSQERTLIQNNAALTQERTNENQNYNSQHQNLTAQIAQVNGTLESLGKQDVQFANNIETVNGYVNVQWISWWDMATLLSPIHPIIMCILLALIILFILNRRGYIPKIELV